MIARRECLYSRKNVDNVVICVMKHVSRNLERVHSYGPNVYYWVLFWWVVYVEAISWRIWRHIEFNEDVVSECEDGPPGTNIFKYVLFRSIARSQGYVKFSHVFCINNPAVHSQLVFLFEFQRIRNFYKNVKWKSDRINECSYLQMKYVFIYIPLRNTFYLYLSLRTSRRKSVFRTMLSMYEYLVYKFLIILLLIRLSIVIMYNNGFEELLKGWQKIVY